MLEVQSITTNGTVTTFNFNDHPQRGAYFFGAFWVKVNTPIVSTDTNTVEFATLGASGSNIPLHLYSGPQAKMSDLVTTGPGIFLCFYDRTTNRLQTIGLK